MDYSLEQSQDLHDEIDAIIAEIVQSIEKTHPIEWESITKELLQGKTDRCRDQYAISLYEKVKELERRQSTVAMKCVYVSQENLVKVRELDKEIESMKTN